MKHLQMRCDLIEVEGGYNVRDLGGYPASDGRLTQKRRFIRTGGLMHVTPRGAAQLLELGVDCIIDLRSRGERKRMPDVELLCGSKPVDNHHIPMLDYIQSNTAGKTAKAFFPSSMPEMYIGLIDSAQAEIRRAFELFADERYSTYLFHCTAGKDRTGVIAALLLLLAGVDEQSVVEDYHWSEQLIEPLREMQRDLPIPERMYSSDPQIMQDMIAHIHEIYGGVIPYLEKIGVSGEDRAAVVCKLLD